MFVNHYTILSTVSIYLKKKKKKNKKQASTWLRMHKQESLRISAVSCGHHIKAGKQMGVFRTTKWKKPGQRCPLARIHPQAYPNLKQWLRTSARCHDISNSCVSQNLLDPELHECTYYGVLQHQKAVVKRPPRLFTFHLHSPPLSSTLRILHIYR